MRDAGIEVDNRPEITAEELVRDAAQYDGMVVRSRTKIPGGNRCGTNLKIVVRGGVGLDNIDVKYARARGSPCATPQGQFRFGGRVDPRLPAGPGAQDPSGIGQHGGRRVEEEGLEGTEIAGKTLGLIGLGNIGQAVLGGRRPWA